MSNETTKARVRRLNEGYWDRIFVGCGIDIGCGADPLNDSCVRWDVKQGDAQLLAGLNAESFDWVYSSHCLEHLTDPKIALRRWWEVLKPGGILFVVVPDEDLYEQGCWPSRFNHSHLWTFTIHKSRTWSPVSLSMVELLHELPEHEVLWLKRIDLNYDYSGGVWDRTLGNAEANIEMVVRKTSSDDR